MNTTTALCTPEHIYAAGQALKLHVEDWDEVSPDLIAHYMNAIVGAPSASGAWLWKQGYEAIEVNATKLSAIAREKSPKVRTCLGFSR